MSVREKLSNDKTIKIVGDTNTLSVEDNLTVLLKTTTDSLSVLDKVDGDLSVDGVFASTGTANIGGFLNVTGNTTLANNLVVGKTVTAEEYSYEYDKTGLVGLSPSEIYNDINVSVTGGTSVCTFIKNPTVGSGVVRVGDPDTAGSAWSFNFRIDKIPLRAKIKGLYIYAEEVDGPDNHASFSASFQSAGLISGTSFTTLVTATANISGSNRQTIFFDLSGYTTKLLTNVSMFRAVISHTGDYTCLLHIHKVAVTYSVEDLDAACSTI
jgi:hypothetical protein